MKRINPSRSFVLMCLFHLESRCTRGATAESTLLGRYCVIFGLYTSVLTRRNVSLFHKKKNPKDNLFKFGDPTAHLVDGGQQSKCKVVVMCQNELTVTVKFFVIVNRESRIAASVLCTVKVARCMERHVALQLPCEFLDSSRSLSCPHTYLPTTIHFTITATQDVCMKLSYD